MGKIIPFDTPIVRSETPVLTAALRAIGCVTVRESELGIHPDTWRRAARAAAKTLGRKVRTYHVNRVLYAELTDWPRDAAEQAIVDREMRKMADRMGQLFDDLTRNP